MSSSRFVFICTHLSFDDERTQGNRWQHDHIAAMREVFEVFNLECMSCFVPGDYLSLHKTLYPMRTQISFKQYNPDKPAKYGLLLKAINAARYPYTFIAAPYFGKPVGDPREYFVSGKFEVVNKIIDCLESIVSLAGRNISFDRLYTSILLVLWLYQKNIFSLGIIQINRKGIPTEVKDIKQREQLSSEIYWQKDGFLSLYSYAVKPSTEKKVLMLSTPEPILGTTKDDNCYKLGLYKLYDFTKGGTDIADQRMGFHTTKTKSKKWILVMFAYAVDTARVNSLTIFTLNQGKDPIKEKSFKCTHQLVVKLVKPTIEMRNQVFLASKIKQKIALVLDRPLLQPELYQNDGPAFGATRKRCNMYRMAAAGKDYSEKFYSLCQDSLSVLW